MCIIYLANIFMANNRVDYTTKYICTENLKKMDVLLYQCIARLFVFNFIKLFYELFKFTTIIDGACSGIISTSCNKLFSSKKIQLTSNSKRRKKRALELRRYTP